MSEELRRTRYALLQMCQQYLQHEDGIFEHDFMTAGEETLDLLKDMGLVVESAPCRYTLTEAGKAVLLDTAAPKPLTATVTLQHRRAVVETRQFEGPTYQQIVWNVRNWLAIEVAPFWTKEIQAGKVRLVWRTESVMLDAALYGVAASWQLVDEVEVTEE